MVAVITGASGGIGYETAKCLMQEHNCQVIAISRNKEQLMKLQQDTGAEVIVFDLLQPLKELIEIIKDKTQYINYLINNAGVLINSPFKDCTQVEIDSVFRTNYTAPALLIKGLLSHFEANKPAHVVNISSMGGFQGSVKFSGLSHYSASKAALGCLTECLALEYQHTNIRFNALALGAVQTPMLEKAFPGYKAPVWPEEMGKFIADFVVNGWKFQNGKIIPVSLSTP